MCGGGEGCRELAALRRDLRRDLGRAWRLMSGSAWSVVSRSIACRAVSHVACAGRAGAVIACGGVWYGRGAQRPYGTEAGEGDCVVSGLSALECAVQRRPGHTNVNSAAFCRDTRMKQTSSARRR